ncbi:transposase [Yoonia sp. R2-816]|uniref:transposase n=1 Tax=Yoonia sp. R2-816 TaxID=3342638 RepID=UPI0037287F62
MKQRSGRRQPCSRISRPSLILPANGLPFHHPRRARRRPRRRARHRKNIPYKLSAKLRKKVEMLFAHLKRILRLGRLRLRGPCGANDEFLLYATAQNLRKLAKIFPAPQHPRKA